MDLHSHLPSNNKPLPKGVCCIQIEGNDMKLYGSARHLLCVHKPPCFLKAMFEIKGF